MSKIHILSVNNGEITFQRKERRRIGTIPIKYAHLIVKPKQSSNVYSVKSY